MTKFKILTNICFFCFFFSLHASAQTTQPISPPKNDPCCTSVKVTCLNADGQGALPGHDGAAGEYDPQNCTLVLNSYSCAIPDLVNKMLEKEKTMPVIMDGMTLDRDKVVFPDCVALEQKLRNDFFKKNGKKIAILPDPLPEQLPKDLADVLEEVEDAYDELHGYVQGCMDLSHELTHFTDPNCPKIIDPNNPSHSRGCTEVTTLSADTDTRKEIASNTCKEYLDEEKRKKDYYSKSLCEDHCTNLIKDLKDLQHANLICSLLKNKCDHLTEQTCTYAFLNCVFKNEEILNNIPTECKTYFDSQKKPNILSDLLTSISTCRYLIYQSRHNCKHYIGDKLKRFVFPVATDSVVNPAVAPQPAPSEAQDPNLNLDINANPSFQTNQTLDDSPTEEELFELLRYYTGEEDFASCPVPLAAPEPSPTPTPILPETPLNTQG